jgi:DNA-binding transcriptional ArsR family regulator
MSLQADQRVFDAIADPTRRAILALLVERPTAVEAIADRFPMSRPAISKHLRVLHEAGLVRRQAAGRQNLYRAEPEPLGEVMAWVEGLWRGRLARLKRLAEGDS